MTGFNVDGRMTVNSLKAKFKETFGVTLRVYQGNNAGRGARPADETKRLGEVADERESLADLGELEITTEMTVEQFEKAFQEKFDIAVQIADAENSKLLENSLKLTELSNA